MGADSGGIELGQQYSGAELKPSSGSSKLSEVRERYAGDPEALRVVQFTDQLLSAMSGKTNTEPLPRSHDVEGIKRVVRIQKDLIRTMVRVTDGGKTPEDQQELNDFYSVARILETSARQELPQNLDSKKEAVARQARAWWNGVKVEAAMISALQYADYDVVIPEAEDVIDVDFAGGTDFLAQKDGRVFAVDAKSHVARGGKGYDVVEETNKGVTQAVGNLSARHFQDAPITRATVTINPRLLPDLPRADESAKQLKNIRNFLTLPEEVEIGFINDLAQIPVKAGV